MLNMFNQINLYKVDFKKLSSVEIDKVLTQIKELSSEEREKVILNIFDRYSSNELEQGKLGYILKQFKEDIQAIFDKNK